MEAEPLWPVLEQMGAEIRLTGCRSRRLQHCLNKFYLQLSVGRVHVCVHVCARARADSHVFPKSWAVQGSLYGLLGPSPALLTSM